MAQQFDHAWLIYKGVIEETIKNSASLQSEAVLKELKNNWLKHLSEQFMAQQNAGIQTKSEPKAAVKIKTEPLQTRFDALGTGVSPAIRPSLSSNVWSTVGDTRMETEAAAAPPEHPTTDVWSGRPVQVSIAPEAPAPTAAGEDAVPPTAAAPSSADPEVVEVIQDDDWGDWEDPEQIEVKQIAAKKESEKPQVSNEVPELSDAAKLESALRLNPAIPRDDDFTATLRTQYGSTGGGGAEDPDDVNSDLEELSSLSDNEPEADDYIIGQCEEMVKPGGRKAQVQGTWKLRLKGGIACIGGREFLFDRLEANLDF